jgi:hypothetical protein
MRAVASSRDDHLINAVQLRAVTGYRCRQGFTRGHLSQILDNRNCRVLHPPVMPSIDTLMLSIRWPSAVSDGLLKL